MVLGLLQPACAVVRPYVLVNVVWSMHRPIGIVVNLLWSVCNKIILNNSFHSLEKEIYRGSLKKLISIDLSTKAVL